MLITSAPRAATRPRSPLLHRFEQPHAVRWLRRVYGLTAAHARTLARLAGLGSVR